MKLGTRGLLAAGTLLVGLATVAADASAQEVNVYSARHYDTDAQLFETFTAETGITVNVIEAGADELIQRILNEGANSPADVLITVDAGRLWRAQEAGVLQPVRSETLEQAIPDYLREPEGHWFGLTKRARVIVYNKDAVDPSELSTYEALADENWKGRVLIRSSTNVYNQSLVGAILATHGEKQTEEWARGIVANLARPPQGGDTDQIKAVAAGEGDVAVVNTYYLARLINSDKPEDRAVAEKVGIFFPNQDDRGTHVNISGAGVAVNAPNKDNAIRFIEYLASPEAQRIFADGNYEFPVVDGVTVNPTVAAWGSFKEDTLSAATFGANNEEALKITDRAGWK